MKLLLIQKTSDITRNRKSSSFSVMVIISRGFQLSSDYVKIEISTFDVPNKKCTNSILHCSLVFNKGPSLVAFIHQSLEYKKVENR